ncbi:hypothetical protein L1049_019248 [Liquidambar formosana]|uniref:FACT complex subunit n=1 Tax=Liquidambar formosana TaxID=63359 RepID=A0AAP0S5G8_LIQFO
MKILPNFISRGPFICREDTDTMGALSSSTEEVSAQQREVETLPASTGELPTILQKAFDRISTEHRNANGQASNGKAPGAGSAYTIDLVNFKDLQYLKSSALNIWLLGYEFPEIILVFMKQQIHFLCSQKKASLLEVVKRSAQEAVGVDVVIHVKAESDDGTALMDVIFRAVHAQTKDAPVVGHIAREAPEGNLLGTWAEKLKNSNFQLSNITKWLSNLFAVKDSGELQI